jgi:uncharacterized protein (TIGR02266 family)
MNVDERRKYPRIDFGVVVFFTTGDGIKYGHVHDISASGAFISTREPAGADKQVFLSFHLPGSDSFLTATGRIVYQQYPGDSEKSGMGVHFEDIDESARDLLEAYVESRV